MIGLDLLIGIGSKIIDRVLPNPEAKAAAHLELAKLAQTGELAMLQADTDLAIAQNKVNEAQANSSDKFTSRMRPMVGYGCMAILLYQGILQPLLVILADALDKSLVPPEVDVYAATSILVALCGVRTIEKVKGVATSWVAPEPETTKKR